LEGKQANVNKNLKTSDRASSSVRKLIAIHTHHMCPHWTHLSCCQQWSNNVQL